MTKNKNIVDILQEAAGFDPLQKISPNTQDADRTKMTKTDLLGQAAIPAVLVGLYKYSRDENNANDIIQKDITSDWTSLIFGENKSSVSKEVAEYADIPADEANIELKCIAEMAVEKIRETVGENASSVQVKKFFTDERNNILLYLPAAMKIGDMIHDPTLDDRTNKMEGPVSNAMHKIEKIFAGSDNPDEKKVNWD
jgi:hypothetical protein